MFFELDYFQSTNKTINQLQQHRYQLANSISKAHSFKQSYNPQNFINESIQNTVMKFSKFRLILNDIRMKIVLPQKFPFQLVKKFINQSQEIPPWFSYVFQQQYDTNKDRLNMMIIQLSTLHDLQTLLEKQKIKVETYSNRKTNPYELLSDKNWLKNISENIQIYTIMIQQIKRSLINFFMQITQRIIQFVQLIFQKSLGLNYQSNKTNYMHDSHMKYFHHHHSSNQLFNISNRYMPSKQFYESPTKFRIPSLIKNQGQNFKKYSSQDKYYNISNKIMPNKISLIETPNILKNKQRLQFTSREYYYDQNGDKSSQDQRYNQRDNQDRSYTYETKKWDWRSMNNTILKSSKSVESLEKSKFDFRRFAQIS